MFGIWTRRKIRLINHWFVLLDDFETVTPEFYTAITDALSDKQMPGLEVQTLEIPEGGSLSQSRIYLRLRRERLIFDVCSAPFGTSWFFSCRFGEIPMRLRPWEVVAMILLLIGVYGILTTLFGVVWGSSLFAMNFIGAIFLLNCLVASGLHDLDAVLLKIPVIGAFYEFFIRRSTYYRDDTRTMYSTAVDRVVREVVQNFAGEHQQGKIEFQSDLTPTGLGFRGRIRMMFEALWPKS